MEQRNMILAFVLSMVVLVGWQMLFPQPDEKTAAVSEQTHKAEPGKKQSEAAAPVQAVHTPTVQAVATPEVVHESKAVTEISNDLLRLEINSRGAVVAALATAYRQDIKPDSPFVSVLETGKSHAIYVNSGILGQTTPEFKIISTSKKNGATTLTLRTQLADGRDWRRQLRLLPASYVLQVEDRIAGGTGIEMFHQVVERNPSRKKSRVYQYRGPIGLMSDKLKEVSFDDLDKESPVRYSAKGGWIAMMNRYFIAAIVGKPERSYRYYFKGDGRTYQAGVLDAAETEGADAVFHSRIYIGPKATPVMKALGAGLERSVDYGWFAFIAKPLHDLLLWFHRYIDNFGLCIILLVILIKLIFYWPTQKSYESMAAMRKLQPEMKRLKELYGDDRQRMGQETMALYKKHKVNPMGGCLPIIIQIPVFFALYKTLLISIELRQAPFYGWIHDLSAMDPYYVLPVLMGASMLIQQRLNPTPPDPMQARIMKFLPVIFTFMFLFFPSGLVLYWLVNNVLAIAQQWYILKVKQAL